jgi:choline-glycine betaine transporter
MTLLDQIPVLFCFPFALVIVLFIVGLYASNHNRAHAMLDNRRNSQQDAGEPAQSTGQRVHQPAKRQGQTARSGVRNDPWAEYMEGR